MIEIGELDLETGFEMTHEFEQGRPSLVDDPAGLQGIDEFDQGCPAAGPAQIMLMSFSQIRFTYRNRTGIHNQFVIA
jgi:hypothetical protein